MSGPIRFVFTVIWFAIALQSCGVLMDATKIMASIAVETHQHSGISYGWWNRQLVNPTPNKVRIK